MCKLLTSREKGMDSRQISGGTQKLALEGSSKEPQYIEQLEEEHSSLRQTYYLWVSRFFILTAVVSMGFMVLASLSLFRLAPLVTVEPFLIINQNSSDGIVRDEPIATDMASKNQLMEMFIKQYVILRNTIIRDEMEMMLRWYPGGMVNFMSSEYVFDAFNTYREGNWDNIIRTRIVREVQIISVNRVGGEKSPVWKVDFRTYDLSDAQRDEATRGLSLRIRYWTASVTAFFIPTRQFVGLRLINPLGFTVTRYSQAEVAM